MWGGFFFGVRVYTLADLPEKVRRNVTVCDNGCWEWQQGRDDDGYGLIWFEGTTRRVTRLVCESLGVDINGKLVRHSCDNPPCCNPNHLLPGTFQDNSNDAKTRCRMLAGEKNPNAKLSYDLAQQIRSEYLDNIGKITQRQLAKKYNVSHLVIGRIVKNQSYRNGDEVADFRYLSVRKPNDTRIRQVLNGGSTSGAGIPSELN